ncbi:MAG TPA: hypothetical protein VJM08_01935, partial [Anaerolineales bacterium]|nr:hypothetical protein [Anaerolineales bacterium]
EPTFGVALFALYWLGRAISVWIAPLLMLDASTTSDLLENIFKHYRLFRRIHIVGLIWSMVVLGSWLMMS